MDAMKKEMIYCLSEGEFGVLADVCGISRMICFDTAAGNELKKLPKGEYTKTIYELCKRGILNTEEGGLTLDGEVADMIALCRRCENVVCFRTNEEQSYIACLYLAVNRDFTLILPGSRQSEYIRISSHPGKELDDILDSYLMESDEVQIFDGKSFQQRNRIKKESEEQFTVEEVKKYLVVTGG